jgi:pimeloyl-ACP methyl ester carboxylesterase
VSEDAVGDTMDAYRPRLLLVPWLTELEWRIGPLLEEWSDVASFDAPGVGALKAETFSLEATAERGLEEIDRRGWDRCVIIADEFGIANATTLAARRPEAVEAMALGHACLSYRRDGDRAPVDGELYGALRRLARTDYRTYARHLTQITQGAYDEVMTERYIERVPMDLEAAQESVPDPETPIGDALKKLDVPLLFAKHDGCLLFTAEGFEDAVEEFPDAETVSTTEKPSASPAFAAALHEFCARARDRAAQR